MIRYGIIIFETSSAAFRGERILLDAGLKCDLIPTPGEFSSDCGVAGRFDWSCKADVVDILQEAGLGAEIHPMPA